MKKAIFLFFSLAITFFFSGNATAQNKPTVAISSVKQNGKTVNFTLTSSKPFIFGGNRYVLYIGDKDFMLNTQSHPNGKGIITFFIPEEDFNSIKEGAGVYLTYGHIFKDGDPSMEAKVAQNSHGWALGKFSKGLLTK
jgi:hypothetical protein